MSISHEAVSAGSDAGPQTGAKTQFLAKMSHEIRTRLDGITGILQLSLEAELPAGVREDLHTMQKSAHALVALLGDILDFARIESGQLELEQTDFDLVTSVEEVVEQFVEQTHAKGVEIFSRLSPAIPRHVRGDAGHLRQVLSRLVSNAVAATEDGQISVCVTPCGSDAASPRVRFAVQDTGAGIDEDKRARLFQPFEHLHDARAGVVDESGLGLSICAALCELMGGTIRLDSVAGRGSEFSFELEFEACSTKIPARMPSAGSLAERSVLVLDSNAGVRESVAELLRYRGVTCSVAASAELGLQMLRDAQARGAPIDAVLVCAQMPGLDLASFTAEIRGAPELRATSVLAGIPGRDHCARGLVHSCGMDALVVKPYRRDALVRRLEGVLSARDDSAKPWPSAPKLKPQETERKLRVLIAEDTRVNQVIAKRMIERLGHEAVVTTNGEEALRALERHSFDLVLMDCQMPVMDGYEATRAIRELASPRRDVPIIAMTADAMRGTRERCIAFGMDDYMTKPVRLDELRMLVERWTESRSLARVEVRPPLA